MRQEVFCYGYYPIQYNKARNIIQTTKENIKNYNFSSHTAPSAPLFKDLLNTHQINDFLIGTLSYSLTGGPLEMWGGGGGRG